MKLRLRIVPAVMGLLLTGCAVSPDGPVWPYPEPPDGDWGYERPAQPSAPDDGGARPEPYQAPDQDAVRDSQPSVSRHPSVQALVDQAEQERAQGDLARASATLERATRIDNNDPLPWLKLGEIRFEQGNLIQAENFARRSLSFAAQGPTARAAWLLIADVKRLQGDTAAARAAQDNAREL